MEPVLVPAAVRTLEIFEAFCAARRPLSLSELARLADMPVSSCHSLMRTLESRGFLHFLGGREAYPSRKLYDLATQIQAFDPIALHLTPALTTLRDTTGETIMLSLRQRHTVQRLLVIESDQTIRYSARIGDIKPLPTSSVGRVLLASLDAEALDEWFAGIALAPAQGRQLRREVVQAREQGHWIAKGANVPDVMSISVPVRLGAAQFGLAIAGPLQRMQPHEKRLLRTVLAAAQSIETEHAAPTRKTP